MLLPAQASARPATADMPSSLPDIKSPPSVLAISASFLCRKNRFAVESADQFDRESRTIFARQNDAVKQ
jgi:hypothetical protein